jgi:hypothetical protein
MDELRKEIDYYTELFEGFIQASVKDFYKQDVPETKIFYEGYQFAITSLTNPIPQYEIYTINKRWNELDYGITQLQKLLPFIEAKKCWICKDTNAILKELPKKKTKKEKVIEYDNTLIDF